MREKPLLLAIVLTFAMPVLAAKSSTVEQLRRTLSAAQSAHETDDAVMKQLAEVTLTFPLQGAALQQLLTMSPGPKTTQALRAIADASTFLDPSPSGLLSTSAPDFATQKAIIGRTISYVSHTMHALPDFLATRVTEHYVDSLRGVQEVAEPRGALYLTATYRAPIAFRDGKETDDPTLTSVAKKGDATGAVKGMTSWGEFGPVLGLVLVDAARSKLSWARWEQEAGKPLAVFQFAVDRSVSHYQMNYCCETTMEAASAAGTVYHPTALKPGYHGTFAVDPDTGTILRIIVEADLRPEDPIQRAATMVEYTAVTIGKRMFYCPTRSVSISVSRAEFESHGIVQAAMRLLLNDVEFVDYHRFGSESRLIAEAPPAAGGSDQPSAATTDTAPAMIPPQPKIEVAGASKAKIEPPVDTPPTAVTPNAIKDAAPPADSSAEAEKEITVGTVNDLPALMENSASAASRITAKTDASAFTLKLTARSVDVGLVADDKHGKPVADLTQDEFEIYDNGRRQQLRAFHHVAANIQTGTAVASPAQPQSTDTFTNTAPTQLEDQPDLFILLLDESHLAYSDLNRARGEVLHFLAGFNSTSRVALYSIGEHGFHVIQDVTTDHALVEKKLAAWKPDASAVSQAQALEQRNRQQIDTVHSESDLNSVNGNQIDSPDSMQTTDPQLRQMGDNPLRYALEGMTALARHFASISGHKSLAWISGDSALYDWNDQAVGIEKGSIHMQMETALLHTKEALNEGHISLYAVDASAEHGGAIEANLENRNVEVNPVNQMGPPMDRDSTAGRTKAQMLQDTHAIQTPVRQLAESTGGRAIEKGSDLKVALDGIYRESSSYYELAFDPDTPADGKFHTLQVKVPSRKDVVLRYRSGYLYSEESATTQQRFQQAIWSPQDISAVALDAETVTLDTLSGESAIKLSIGFPSLSLIEKDGRWTDEIYIFIAERDDATQKAAVSGETLKLSLKPNAYESGMPAGIPYMRRIQTISKLGSVRVIVVDGNSGKMGSITLPASALHPQ